MAILGIDASNIRLWGGVTHLVELLRVATPQAHGFEKVVVWGSTATLDQLQEQDWLQKVPVPLLDKALPYRVFWQRFRLRKLVIQAGCDLLFVPGGSDASGFRPMVAMSQNRLPFDRQESGRYGLSWNRLRLLYLRGVQTRTFRGADGIIFLTNHAREHILSVIGKVRGKVATIPHGVGARFLAAPRPQRAPATFTASAPCRIVYVSIVDRYKHQWHVAVGVARLRAAGVHVVLDLIGPPASGLARLQASLKQLDPRSEFIRYRGTVPYEQLHEHYCNADIGLFASSCESFPLTLAETMSAGLPIACSDRMPMPEILGAAGEYFDPEVPDEIAHAIRRLIESPELRRQKAQAAYDRACGLSWENSSNRTFEFLAEIIFCNAPPNDPI
jgi:glycosyltransferase involved in cell wall biosynthesis